MSTVSFMNADGEWKSLGDVFSGDWSLSGSDESEDPYPLFSRRWVTGMDQPSSYSMEFEIIDVDQYTIELMLGQPIHPRKRKGLTGKAYRAECRAYQRRRKAHRRGQEGWYAVT